MSNTKLYSLLSFTLLACAIFMGYGSSFSPQQLQPSTAFTADLSTLESSPYEVLQFMAADTLFIICYISLLVVLYSKLRKGEYHLALIALTMGLTAGFFDLLENSFFISYAQSIINQNQIPDIDIQIIYVIANMKWMAIYVSMFINAILWSREFILNKLIAISMISNVAIGVLSIAIPYLLNYRPYPFVATFVLLAIYFWKTPTDGQ